MISSGMRVARARRASRVSSSARVPTTTRVAPAASSSSTALVVRTPPPTCTGTSAVARAGRDDQRVVRAAPRRRVEVDDVEPREAVARPRRARRRPDRRGARAPRRTSRPRAARRRPRADRPREWRSSRLRRVASSRNACRKRTPAARALLGMELHADRRARAHRGREAVALVRAPRDHDSTDPPGGRRSCWRSTRSASGAASNSGSRARRRVFQPICGTRCARSRVTRPGMRPSPAPVALVARVEQQLHAEADAEARQPAAQRRRASPSRPGARRSAAAPNAPTPGSTSTSVSTRAHRIRLDAHVDARRARAPWRASAGCPRRSRRASRACERLPQRVEHGAPSTAHGPTPMRSASPSDAAALADPAASRSAHAPAPRAHASRARSRGARAVGTKTKLRRRRQRLEPERAQRAREPLADRRPPAPRARAPSRAHRRRRRAPRPPRARRARSPCTGRAPSRPRSTSAALPTP